LEDAFAGRVLVADRHEHRLVLAVLRGLVAQADGRRLAPAHELIGEDRRVEVEDLHWSGGYRSLCASSRYASASATISRSAAWLRVSCALARVIRRTTSTSSSSSGLMRDR